MSKFYSYVFLLFLCYTGKKNSLQKNTNIKQDEVNTKGNRFQKGGEFAGKSGISPLWERFDSMRQNLGNLFSCSFILVSCG